MHAFAMTAVVGLMAMSGGAQLPPGVTDTSTQQQGGERVLQQSIDIAAPPACVWRGLTDEAGIKAFGMAVAQVELRNGGLIEEGFRPDAKMGGSETIRHRIIAYLPERLLVLRNEATPPGLPHAELYRNVVQIVSVEPQGGDGHSRFTISHTGYGAGAEYDQLYRFFAQGNPSYLTAMKAFCEGKSAPSSAR